MHISKTPGVGNSNPPQFSCLENSHGQRSLAGYSPWPDKESDTIVQACLTPSSYPWTEECGGVQSMGSQRVRHNWATNTTYSVNPGAIGLEIRLIKTIQRLVAVSIMGTWKALFVSPFQYTTLKDLEFNRGSLPHPPGHQRKPHICVSEGGWAGMHGGGRTGEQWRQTQSTILDSHGSGWACSPREPHSSRGSSYPSFLVTSESVSTGSWAVEAAGPMTPVPPAVAALLSPVPHPCHRWQYPQTPQPQVW